METRGGLSASTLSGSGGNIFIQTEDLRLRDRSTIATNAGSSDGGNIAIVTEILAAIGDSDITADAEAGLGGRVQIEAMGIFGILFRDFPTSASDITVTSALGPEFSGTVELVRPEVDPGSALVELPENPINVAILFDRDSCRNFFYNGEFYFVGRGGIPPNPLGESIPYPPTSDRLWIATGRGTQAAGSNLDVPAEIVEATRWEIDRDGNVVTLPSEDDGDRERWHRQERCNDSPSILRRAASGI